MNVYFPSPALSPYVKLYRIVESEGELVNRILPDTSLVMALRFKGEVRAVMGDRGDHTLPAMMISGLRRSGRLINYTRAGNVLVIFKEGGAQAFLREPLHELYDLTVPLTALAGYNDLSQLEDRLGGADSHSSRIGYVEHFLLSRLRAHEPDRVVVAALAGIQEAHGILRMKMLADKLCVSQDVLEKRFRRAVGVTPKVFSSVVRMKSILSQATSKMRLAEAALDAGYFDQPHFNKDFKLFTGQTPTEFLKSPVRW
jgi:AraC-like DNA-binding protein